MLETSRMVKTVDVRDEKDIEEFENMLSRGPITIVLVYADWCGHCTTYKKNVWSKLKNISGRKLPLVSVREDQFPKTSISGSKIEGYPTVLVVGKDKKAADFQGTNALPNHSNLEMMTDLVKKDPESVLNSMTPSSKEAELTPEASSLRAPNMVDDNMNIKKTPHQYGGSERKGSLIDFLSNLVNSRTPILTRRNRRKQPRKQLDPNQARKLKRRATRNRK